MTAKVKTIGGEIDLSDLRNIRLGMVCQFGEGQPVLAKADGFAWMALSARMPGFKFLGVDPVIGRREDCEMFGVRSDVVQYYGDFEKLASQAKGELLVAQTEMDVYRTLVESIVGKRANIGETLSAFLKVYRVLRAAADQVGCEAFKEYPVSNTPQPKE